MDLLLEASKASGLSVDDLQKIVALIDKRGHFSAARAQQELYNFCCKIGMVQFYFKITSLEMIANHIESILAAEIIAMNRGGKELEVDLVSERADSAMYLINDDHQKGIEIERRIENNFPDYRMQSYRTAGISLESHFRSIFIQKPVYAVENPEPTEDDIQKVGAKQFVESTTQEAIERYQRVLRTSLSQTQPYIECIDPVRDEIRFMISLPRSDSHRILTSVSNVINYYGLASKHKYIEPFSNGKTIFSLYLDAEKARPYKEDLITDLSLVCISPEDELSPLIGDCKLSAHEVFYAAAIWKFTHQFFSSFNVEYLSLENALKNRPDLLDILHELRTRLVKDSFTENRILQTIYRHPDQIKTLYQQFSNRFKQNGKVSEKEIEFNFSQIQNEIDRDILTFFRLFNKVVLKTNFYKRDKVSLAFRLDPALFLDAIEYRDKPYGVFMVMGKEFRGFHVRFRDIARGGIRIVQSRDAEIYDKNSDSIFDENYNLALTQQKKNKDIPEGGSKGTILLNLAFQKEGHQAFKKYVDGLLDLMLPDEALKDYFGKPEILFLGPDEGTADLMSWASQRAKTRGYKLWKSISTGKPLSEGGIPHDLYGMTTNSVHEYILGILDKLGLSEEKVTKIQTGGPDGDLGSNEITISKDNTLAVIDGSGVLYDPQGINRTELTRLAEKRLMVEHFNKAKLSPLGFLVHINERDIVLPNGTKVANGLEFRNLFHLNPMLQADFFVPCGGRPNSVNMQNWKQLLNENGVPRFKYIVEGANLFLVQSARLALEEKGVIIFKDASANKGGVTSSSLEVLASLALTDEEYSEYLCVRDDHVPAFRQQYVQDVIEIIRSNARHEFNVMWNEHQQNKTPYTLLTDLVSNKINDVTDAIHDSDLWQDPQLMRKVVQAHCPPTLVKQLGIETILKRVPQNYLQAIVSSWLASHYIYKYGLHANEVDFNHFLKQFSS
ncbi:NAD-glutamate dehydrogenase [candidate division KSB1 bacterium]|nr:NAD-glutamate dehydrogenase [candidate division KSB1 bacterium]